MSFKVGDKVRFNDPNEYRGRQHRNVFTVRAVVYQQQGPMAHVFLEGDNAFDSYFAYRLEKVPDAQPLQAAGSQPAGQALRHNSGKPKLSYLLTFEGGIQHVFPGGEFNMLASWYQGVADFKDCVGDILRTLKYDWPVLLARVSEYGERKYARGNYLAGASWSQYCDCMLRHAYQKAIGKPVDEESGAHHDGHIAWNLLMLGHAISTFPELDDRVRAPGQEFDIEVGEEPEEGVEFDVEIEDGWSRHEYPDNYYSHPSGARVCLRADNDKWNWFPRGAYYCKSAAAADSIEEAKRLALGGKP